jgi:hypothetical protein
MYNKKNYDLLVNWMNIVNTKRSLSDYLRSISISKIAIYGMNEIGILLYDNLVRDGLEVPFVIDKRADYLQLDIDADIRSAEDSIEGVDVVIVAAVNYYSEIEKELEGKGDYRIISLMDLIMKA